VGVTGVAGAAELDKMVNVDPRDLWAGNEIGNGLMRGMLDQL
jgi:hypothetical protein